MNIDSIKSKINTIVNDIVLNRKNKHNIKADCIDMYESIQLFLSEEPNYTIQKQLEDWLRTTPNHRFYHLTYLDILVHMIRFEEFPPFIPG